MPSRARPEAKANTTDPDSRVMKTSLGYLQGDNAQAVVGPGQIVLAAELSACAADVGQLEPLLGAAAANLVAAGVRRPIGTLVADAGYLSAANLADRGTGPELLIATQGGRHRARGAGPPAPRGRIRARRPRSAGRRARDGCAPGKRPGHPGCGRGGLWNRFRG